MIVKTSKANIIVITTLIIIIAQVCLPIFENKSIATAESIEGWDISTSQNGKVVAKLDDSGILTISGAGSMKNWDWNSENYAPWYEERANITAINIDEGITTVGKSAFVGCSNLTSITMPQGIMSIGSYAFMDCTSLENVEIPEGATSLGDGSFSKCTSLKGITLSKELVKIGNSVFSNCTSLEKIVIPGKVGEIGNLAFEGCTNLTTVIIPKEVSNIHHQAFIGCDSINIICNSSSMAETYAKEMGIAYFTDDEKPEIEFLAEELDTNSQKLSIMVNVTDSLVGIKENSLKYKWSTKSSGVQIDEIVTSFKSGDVIEKEAVTGDYYLWVTACDYIGNRVIINTTACNFDNTLPTITVNQKLEDSEEITITAADLGTGLAEDNSYEYYISSNDTTLDNGEWQAYVSGMPIKVQEGKTEDYYLFIKRISDNAGNMSDTNATIVTINEEIYHRFGPYSREVESVGVAPNFIKGDMDGDGEITFSDITQINRARLGREELNEEQFLTADINNDGIIDMKDITEINNTRQK